MLRRLRAFVTTNWSDTAWSLVCRGLASRHLLLIKALTPCCKVSAFNCLPAPSQNQNVAAVIVTADLPAFSKQGQTIDITVSSIGSAKSLRGGTLMQTFLKGLDGQVYAVAQGNLVVSGFSATGADGSKIVGNNPTVGMISSGAIVEREVPNPFGRGDYITFNLFESDFTTAQRLADAVNQFLGPKWLRRWMRPQSRYVLRAISASVLPSSLQLRTLNSILQTVRRKLSLTHVRAP